MRKVKLLAAVILLSGLLPLIGWADESRNTSVTGDGPSSNRNKTLSPYVNAHETVYKLSVGVTGGWSFIASKTSVSGGVPDGTEENPAFTTSSSKAKRVVADPDSPEIFTLGLSGELTKPGGSAGGTVSWGVSAATDFYYVLPKEKIISIDSSATFTAKANSSAASSNWTCSPTWIGYSAINGQSSISAGSGGNWTPPAGQYTITAKKASDTSRTDTADLFVVNLQLNHNLWWFNGENPGGGYNITATLNAIGLPSGTWTWTVTSGSSIVALSNSGAGGWSSTKTTTGTDNDIIIKSTGASTSPNDVEITLSNGTFTIKHVMTVKAPDYLIYNTGTPGTPIVPITDVALNAGFQTTIRYKVVDQSGAVLPYNVPINEEFISPVYPDHIDADWPRTDPNGLVTSPNNFWDTITFAPPSYLLWLYAPDPVNPGATGHTTPVDHWFGKINVGSTTIGSGLTVKTLTWQRYRGRGRHL